MKPIKPEGSNFTYTAPAGTESECADLHVRLGIDGTFGPAITSVWQPDADEQRRLHAGGAVALTIFAKGHPVVSVGVEGVAEEQLSEADSRCPILAIAPAEYTYWEKRVWRQGVCDMEVDKRVAQAVRNSMDVGLFVEPPLGPVAGWAQDWICTDETASWHGARTTTFDDTKTQAEDRIPVCGWTKLDEVYPVGRIR